MNNREKSQFRLDYAVPPGEILLETLDAKGMKQAEFATRTGRPRKTVNEVIKARKQLPTDRLAV